MRKLLYTLPIAVLFGVGTAGAQFGSDSEGEQRNRPENVKPETPLSNTQGSERPGASQSGTPLPMGSDTEAEQRNRPESQNSSEDRQGGWQERSAAQNSAPIVRAQEVASAKDNQKVQLRGKILSQQNRNQYLLSDGTGNVLVEINNRLLKGQKLAVGSEVEVRGDVDKRFFGKSAKVEARSVMVLAASQISPPAAPMKDLPAGGQPDERG